MVTNATDEDLHEEELDTTKASGTEPAPSEEGTQSEESPVEEKAPAEPDTTLTTPPETEKDLAWYQKAYPESTKEALRLKQENDELKASQVPPPVIESQKTEDGAALTIEQLYIRGKQKEETDAAFAEIRKNYPQVNDPEEYKRFVATAQVFGRAISDGEGRFPSPAELYRKTVIDLGWTDDSSDRLGAALKDGASSPRVPSGTAQPAPTSKVTDAMMAANRRWYPDKSDAEIREELEPHVQLT